MTDDEPEPFVMPTEPSDDPGPALGPEPEAEPVAEAESPGEALEALVAAAQEAVEEAAASDDPDHTSAAMWGDADDEVPTDPADVWSDAAAASAENVWDLDGDEDSVWNEFGTGPAPIAAEPEPPPARPAAAEGMDHVDHDEEEPEAFAFPLGADDDRSAPPTPAVPTAADEDDEPEAFTFAVTDAPVPAHDATDEPVHDDEPAADEPADAEPLAHTEPADHDVDEPGAWTPVAAGTAADEEEDDEDDDVWISSVAHDDSAPLAEAARPRDDTGWRDLEAAQEPSWSVPDLPLRPVDDDEDEPAAFSMSVDTAGDADALGALLDDAEASTATATPDTDAPAASGGYAPGALADLDLDHLDDMVAAVEAAPAAAADDGAGADEEHAEDDGTADGDDAVADDAPLDAPTAARQVLEPGQVAFSSSRKKRRGLFG